MRKKLHLGLQLSPLAWKLNLLWLSAALLVETAICLTSANSVPDFWQNAVVAAGVAGLGASLYLVHMYVTPIKRFMQVRANAIAASHFANRYACITVLHLFPAYRVYME